MPCISKNIPSHTSSKAQDSKMTKKLIEYQKSTLICLTHLLILIEWSLSSGNFIILPRAGELNERQTSLTSDHENQ